MQRKYFVGGILFLILGLTLCTSEDSASAQTIDPAFAANYSIIFQGTPPGVPANSGGFAFKFDDANTLLICGTAETANGAIFSIGVTRDAGGHINGFAGPAANFATAPQCDGGLAYGPANDVLFYSRWPTNELGEIKVGSTMTDRVINLAPLGVEGSHSALSFVPDAIGLTAGNLKMVTWSGGQWNDSTPSPDATGAYDVDPVTQVDTSRLPGGPEGIIYVPTTSPQFATQSMLIAAYSSNTVDAYQVDDSGDPIVATRQRFMTMPSAEGCAQDPVSGDMLFGRFGGGAFVVVVRGFQLPPPPPPARVKSFSLIKEENEWRVLSPINRLPASTAEFRPGKSTLIPFQKFSLTDKEQKIRMD